MALNPNIKCSLTLFFVNCNRWKTNFHPHADNKTRAYHQLKKCNYWQLQNKFVVIVSMQTLITCLPPYGTWRTCLMEAIPSFSWVWSWSISPRSWMIIHCVRFWTPSLTYLVERCSPIRQRSTYNHLLIPLKQTLEEYLISYLLQNIGCCM